MGRWLHGGGGGGWRGGLFCERRLGACCRGKGGVGQAVRGGARIGPRLMRAWMRVGASRLRGRTWLQIWSWVLRMSAIWVLERRVYLAVRRGPPSV